MSDLWDVNQIRRHILSCEHQLEVSTYDSPVPRIICGCGEVARHTPAAVARAELDRDCPPVELDGLPLSG